MRAAVFASAALQAAIFLMLLGSALLTHTDAAGDGMAQGFAVVAGLILALSGGPALLLAALNRALGFALIWSLLPLLFLFVLLA